MDIKSGRIREIRLNGTLLLELEDTEDGLASVDTVSMKNWVLYAW